MRPLMPRLQTTILPVAAPGGERRLAERVLDRRRLSVAARTTGVGDEMPLVSVTPGTSSVAPPSAVRCSVEVNERGPVEAPTVVTHGPP